MLRSVWSKPYGLRNAINYQTVRWRPPWGANVYLHLRLKSEHEVQMKAFVWFLCGGGAVILCAGIFGAFFLRSATGFSAREQPSGMEEWIARKARAAAMPNEAKLRANPIPNSAEIVSEARAHWADHCASCHANNGSGETDLGKHLYPPAPDMRAQATQHMSDGELFYIIENGIRLSGMPAWGTGKDSDAQDSWKLVHFIRHLPRLADEEIKEMEKLNPKSLADLEEEKQEEEFLKGNAPTEAPKQHRHH